MIEKEDNSKEGVEKTQELFMRAKNFAMETTAMLYCNRQENRKD